MSIKEIEKRIIKDVEAEAVKIKDEAKSSVQQLEKIHLRKSEEIRAELSAGAKRKAEEVKRSYLVPARLKAKKSLLEEKQKICFVVGGTGLYIKSLLGGLLKCPPTDHELRKKLFHECEEYGSFFLHERLKVFDPASAFRIHPHDKMRVLRALEIISLTNKPLSSLIRKHGFKDRPYHALKICLQMDRDQLYRRINKRTLVMIEKGLVTETEVLLRKGYSPDIKPMKSLGYRHIIKLLEGDLDLDETIRQLQRDTRRYAKRQLTWFKSDHEMVWVGPHDRDLIVKNIQEFI